MRKRGLSFGEPITKLIPSQHPKTTFQTPENPNKKWLCIKSKKWEPNVMNFRIKLAGDETQLAHFCQPAVFQEIFSFEIKILKCVPGY